MMDAFKKDLLSLSDREMVNKYYLSGAAIVFDDDHQYRLRQTVADYFSIDFTEVFLVGSAKLGFSIKPQRRFLPFSDKSDIDVVLVCQTLFEEIWKEVYSFEKNGGYWPKMNDFKAYHFQGWIRPDKLPLEPSFTRTRTWWEFFENLCSSGDYGPYKIRGGLYHSRFFFDSYQRKCFDQCRSEVKN